MQNILPPRRSTSPRAGLAMTEVMTVIVCVSTMLMILVPAMMQSKTAAQRVNCQNQLKQIGLGLTQYEQLYNAFPPGYMLESGSTAAAQSAFGWMAALLPFVDQAPLASQVNWTQPVNSYENMQLWQHSPSVYLCPSDPQTHMAVQDYMFTPVPSGTMPGQANYVASFGPGDMWAHPDDRQGIFSRNSTTRIAEITDGLSHTLLAGERLNGVVVPPSKQAAIELKTYWPGLLDPSLQPDAALGHTVLFRAGHVANSADADERDAWSAHPEGAQFLMADGSVISITRQIDLKVYRALSTRAGGEMDARLPSVR